MLKKEMKNYKDEATEKVDKIIEELEEYYEEDDQLEAMIYTQTKYTTLEAYKNSLLLQELEKEYIERYIIEEELDLLDDPDLDENDKELYLKYKYHGRAIRDLFEKYNIEFEDEDFEDALEKHLDYVTIVNQAQAESILDNNVNKGSGYYYYGS